MALETHDDGGANIGKCEQRLLDIARVAASISPSPSASLSVMGRHVVADLPALTPLLEMFGWRSSNTFPELSLAKCKEFTEKLCAWKNGGEAEHYSLQILVSFIDTLVIGEEHDLQYRFPSLKKVVWLDVLSPYLNDLKGDLKKENLEATDIYHVMMMLAPHSLHTLHKQFHMLLNEGHEQLKV